MPTDIEKIFSTLPNDEFWKLIIDTKYWEKGEFVFDNDAPQTILHLHLVYQPKSENLHAADQNLSAGAGPTPKK
jgi:hypothetical protein